MAEIHSRSDRLKLALTYDEWDLIAAATRTVTKGLKAKGAKELAQKTDRLTLYIEDLLAAIRSEGHV
jgi:hypothetical protein